MADKTYQMNAILTFGMVTQVSKEVFLNLVKKQENPLVLQSWGRIFSFKKHYRYLLSYKGLIFFTKCYNPIEWHENVEIINVQRITVPSETFTIY